VLATKYHWDIVSFGDHVRNVARMRALPATRITWQRLGLQLLTELGPARFVHEVLAASKPGSAVHLYDGPRQVGLLVELDRLYDQLVIIYLDVPRIERYARWVIRQRPGDPVGTLEEFDRISVEQIERDVPAIRLMAHSVINVGLSIADLLERIELLLTERGYPLHPDWR